MKFIKEHRLFFLILSVSALLRFVPLLDYQFTLDELSGLNRTRFGTFSELIEKGVKIDAHPAFVQVLIFYLVKLFGYTNWVVKLPFLLFSLGASIYAYALLYRNYSKASALLALLIFSFSLVFVFYAPIARMYISGVFFSLGLLYHFFELVFKNSRNKWDYALMALFALLSSLNQHINALFAFTVCLSGLILIPKTSRIQYVISCFGAVLFYLPHLPVSLYQLSLGGIGLEQGGWLEKPNWYSVFDFIILLFGTWKVYWLLLLLLSINLISEGWPRIQKSQLFLLVIFLLNYWIVYQYSFHQAPVYQHSSMLFSGVGVVIFISSLFTFRQAWHFYTSLSLIGAALLFTTYIKKDYFGNCVRSVFEEQFRIRKLLAGQYHEEKVLSYFFDSDEFMQELYGQKYPSTSELHYGDDPSIRSNAELINTLSKSKADVLVLSSPMPLQEEISKHYFPYPLEQLISQGNNVRVFTKNKSYLAREIQTEKMLWQGSICGQDDFRFEEAGRPSGMCRDLNLKTDSLNEFPLSAGLNYADLGIDEGNVILVEVKGKFLTIGSNALEACISIQSQKEVLHYTAGSVKDAIVSDSSFCFYTQLYCGSRHRDWLKNNAWIQVYLWNKDKKNYLVENIRIKAIEYWPQKWGFWR